MSCKECAKSWNDVFKGKGKVQILQVPELGNGIFRVAACDEHFEALKEIIKKGLKPAPKPNFINLSSSPSISAPQKS